MKILFFRPKPPMETIGLQHVMVVEPLELELLATRVANVNEVEIIDLILEKQDAEFFIEKKNPDIVCVTGYITHTNNIIEICRKAKKYNSKIITIVGGVNIEKSPETVDCPEIDYRIVRNALVCFPELIDYLQNKSSMPKGILRYSEKMHEADLPAFDFIYTHPNRELTAKYRARYFYVFHNKVSLIKTSFGCPFKCNFCFCRKITNDIYSERSITDVVHELQEIREKEVYIVDDNFLVSDQRVSQFLNEIEKRNIRKKYLIYGRADFISNNKDLLTKFRKLGLRTIIVGLESFNDGELLSLEKNIKSDVNEKAMEVLDQCGIDCYASIIAMPEWGIENFKAVAEKLIKLKVRFVNIQPLTPLLHTDMQFDESRLVIARNEYPKWDLAHVVVRPEKLSIQDYYLEILKLYQTILFQPSNLVHHLKYSPFMQAKLALGIYKVRKQYLSKILISE